MLSYKFQDEDIEDDYDNTYESSKPKNKSFKI